jgi:formylglycine-generating enzyme required for sulfatase activity
MRCFLILTSCCALSFAQRVSFEKQVQPILEKRCLPCHDTEKPAGALRMDKMDGLLRGGSKGPAMVPVKPEQSLMMKLMDLPKGTAFAMPPDGPLPQAERDAIREWISTGAPWPKNIVLGATAPKGPNEMGVVQQIRERVVASKSEPSKPYKQSIPGTDVSYEMLPIPAGEFTMGTPATEKSRGSDEGPQRKVKVDPFWMGKFEVTWDEYRLFMLAQQADRGKDAVVDGISRPTRPYVEMSFGMGINGFPAISMTQHAANKYAEWLSAKTGHFYRLPTEAEWEYACRAGTSTAYSFGDSPSAIAEYAWYGSNANGKYEKVGTKKPNPWGLHDMHGNVMEWVLDQYAPYKPAAGLLTNPWNRATEPYPLTARGGSWNDDPDKLRCGARIGSDPTWKMQDPQLPKSIWYFTDAQWLGFRLVRPVKVPTAEDMHAYWNNGVEQEQ